MSEQPVPETRPALAGHGAGRSRVSYLALLPTGFSVPPRLLAERWALTPPFHPCRGHTENRGGFSFCGTFRRCALTRPAHVYPGQAGLHGVAPCGVRTFLPGPAWRDQGDSPPFQDQHKFSVFEELFKRIGSRRDSHEAVGFNAWGVQSRSDLAKVAVGFNQVLTHGAKRTTRTFKSHRDG